MVLLINELSFLTAKERYRGSEIKDSERVGKETTSKGEKWVQWQKNKRKAVDLVEQPNKRQEVVDSHEKNMSRGMKSYVDMRCIEKKNKKPVRVEEIGVEEARENVNDFDLGDFDLDVLEESVANSSSNDASPASSHTIM